MEENKQTPQGVTNRVEQPVFVPVEVPSVEPMMIVRLLVFALALINAVGAMFGFDWNLSLDQKNAYDVISALLLLGSGIHVAWKNNNITKQSRVQAHVAEQVNPVTTENTKGE